VEEDRQRRRKTLIPSRKEGRKVKVGRKQIKK
jgi:hypothetical protein